MRIQGRGLDLIEEYAEKMRDAHTMLLCQCLREIIEIKELLIKQNDNPGNSSD